jgi:phosphatidylglycerophosphatase C
VPEPPNTRPVVAAFDVDGTLTTQDCVVPFLRRAAGWRLAPALLRHPLAVIGALARRDRDRLKELASMSLAGRDAVALDRLGTEFTRDFVEHRLRDDTTARLARHRELGHTVILASASFESYLAPLGAALEVDGIVCTRLERDADGRLTGRLAGANCRGPEKARRVLEWVTQAGLDGAELWAYGDSPGDAELLAAADHPIRVDGVRIDPEPG